MRRTLSLIVAVGLAASVVALAASGRSPDR